MENTHDTMLSEKERKCDPSLEFKGHKSNKGP